MDLAAATWTELAGPGPRLLLVPVGSCEQHGPHLPFDTDTRIALAVAGRTAALDDRLVVGPAVNYGSSGEHQSFPGTLSIGTETLTAVLVELGRSAFPLTGPSAFDALVFVNGHGGNTTAVSGAVDLLRAEGRPVHAWWPSFDATDAHAGRTETSLVLAIFPDVVRAERPAGNTAPLAELLEPMREGGVRSVTANGVLGDATGASAQEGARLLDDLVADLRRLVTSVMPT